jgi:hypothetical protein
MLAEFGYGVLVVSFIVTVYSGFAAYYGAQKKSASLVESARRAQLLTFPLIDHFIFVLFICWSTIVSTYRSSTK